MTTVAQVREVVQPLLQRNPDLALVGRLVVIKPVHHILRGIYIDRSLDSQLFIPTWAVTFLFEPSESFSYNWGGRLYNRAHGAWVVTNPATSAVMCEENRLGLVRLLRDWEASSVEHLKLQKLWEPTPFPIELQRERE